jgi:hypothetical protein
MESSGWFQAAGGQNASGDSAHFSPLFVGAQGASDNKLQATGHKLKKPSSRSGQQQQVTTSKRQADGTSGRWSEKDGYRCRLPVVVQQESVVPPERDQCPVTFFGIGKLRRPQSIEIKYSCATKSKIVFHTLDPKQSPADSGRREAALGSRLSALGQAEATGHKRQAMQRWIVISGQRKAVLGPRRKQQWPVTSRREIGPDEDCQDCQHCQVANWQSSEQQ